ncbi:hypothetical protein HPB51_023876 [Rhipicephalus microplus]|uniref:Uncharacterized protein n=1 Tax=Rhipicephalus microplus TaxID=6941 RepID=A0A9J6DDI5_RHIMP|nr:hypothetical protein HPB51_023876 [Rhipicephalus microplus]
MNHNSRRHVFQLRPALTRAPDCRQLRRSQASPSPDLMIAFLASSADDVQKTASRGLHHSRCVHSKHSKEQCSRAKGRELRAPRPRGTMGTTVFRESLPDVFPGCGTNVAIQDISESVESFLRLPSCKCATNFRESLSAVLPIRDESVAIQDAPKSVKRKVKSRNVRRRLVFETARKVFAPKHNTDYKHFSVKRKVGKMKSCAEDGVQTSSVAVPITEYYAEFGTGVFPTSSALKDIGTQVDLPSFLKKNEEGKSSLSAVLLPTEDEKKSMAVTSTQTDVQWETCIPSGNEKRDLELCCLREHLTLALEEAQSKALLAMDLQLHLDRSAKEVELRDQVVNNLEKKLSAARQQTDNLKKQQTSVECELESVRSLLRKEKAESQQYLLKLEKMAITVKHLQDALVECKKTVGAASAAVEPKVHDV